jgi:hypothetical protein
MSDAFPTFAEQGERNIKDAIAREEIRFEIMMRYAPDQFIDPEVSFR